MEKAGGTYIEIPDRREAIEYSIFHAQPGDMIAVIGKGHEDYQEIEGVRYPFLDRQVIEETIEKFKQQEARETGTGGTDMEQITVKELLEATGGRRLCGTERRGNLPS